MPNGDTRITPLSREEGNSSLTYSKHKRVAKGYDFV
jgi:hypothetical protein